MVQIPRILHRDKQRSRRALRPAPSERTETPTALTETSSGHPQYFQANSRVMPVIRSERLSVASFTIHHLRLSAHFTPYGTNHTAVPSDMCSTFRCFMNVVIILCSHSVFNSYFQNSVFFVYHLCYFLFIPTFLCALFLHEHPFSPSSPWIFTFSFPFLNILSSRAFSAFLIFFY